MAMSDTTARDRLAEGCAMLDAKAARWKRREDYLAGEQDMPYAPPGVNAEYRSLQEQAIANWLGIAMGAPLQRMNPVGFMTGRSGSADQEVWDTLWQPNNLDSRIRSVLQDMTVHGRGLMSVWPNGDTPRIRPENGSLVHVEGDPEDPWTQEWAVKRVTVKVPQSQRTDLWVPASMGITDAKTFQRAWVHDYDSFRMYELRNGRWEFMDEGSHDMGALAFVPFDNRVSSSADYRSDLEPLMPMQDAINTIRFQTLLAMQFSAYRQRIVVGYDPVLRDANGQMIPQRDGEGNVLLDPRTGQPMPIVQSPGRPGVDRLLVFPGDLTKVFDMPESNMSNYVTVLGEFLTQFFAIAQVPPQYLLSRMANLSGDALTAAESTLHSHVVDLQTASGESLETVIGLAERARGNAVRTTSAQVMWADDEARSFSGTVDAVVKLISQGMAPQDAWAMLPNATPTLIAQWVDHANARRQQALAEVGAKPVLPTPGGITPPADSAAAGAQTQQQVTQSKPPQE